MSTGKRSWWRSDLAVGMTSLALALWVTGRLWSDPSGRASAVNSGDQALFEWLLSYGAYTLTNGQNPYFTQLLNVPDGVNLAVNTSITVYAVLFTPITMLFGPTVSFLVILTGNLAGSAYAWYWLFGRYLAASPLGAAVGGLFCGFAPAMVSHANAHLNWTAQWILPLIIARVLQLARRKRPVHDGLILGALIAVAFSLTAEALFFTAMALGVFTAVWAYSERTAAKALARQFALGVGVAAGVAAALLAYPLWLHFFGPQGFHGTGFDPRIHNEDLAAYVAWPQRSLAGALGLNTHLAPNPTEENSFFGAPLIALTILGFVLFFRDQSRRVVVRALAITAGVFAVLSLGPQLRVLGRLTPIPLPEALLTSVPLFNAALPSRLALVVAPIIGIILAWLVTELSVRAELRARAVLPVLSRRAWIAGCTAALLPLFPLQLTARERDPVPDFFVNGAWRQRVPDGAVILPIPLPSDLVPDGQRWQTDALRQAIAGDQPVFRLPAGFFLGPGGPDGTGRIGPVPRPTAELLEEVAKTGMVPPITGANLARAGADLAYWDASIIVLADQVHGAHWDPHQPALLEAATALFGPPTRVSDVWIWQVS